MKKIASVIFGLWCGFTSFISPVWLGMVSLNLTGMVYKYDDSMDEGTAGIMGIALLFLWLLFVMIPHIYFARKLYLTKKTYLIIYLFCITVLSILYLALCGWDIIRFLTV